MIHINLGHAVEEKIPVIGETSHECAMLFNGCMKNLFDIFENVERGHRVDKGLYRLKEELSLLRTKSEMLASLIDVTINYEWAKLTFSPDIIEEIRAFQVPSIGIEAAPSKANHSLESIMRLLIYSIDQLFQAVDQVLLAMEEDLESGDRRLDGFQEMAWRASELQKVATAVSIVSRFPS